MTKEYKIRHFTHTYTNEPEEAEKEILLKTCHLTLTEEWLLGVSLARPKVC